MLRVVLWFRPTDAAIVIISARGMASQSPAIPHTFGSQRRKTINSKKDRSRVTTADQCPFHKK